jgi:hypothetical protein
MKRLFPPLAALIVLGSPVHAADSISFVVGGHRIHIEASRHCNSASCLSVSIPGVYERRGRDRYDDDRDATALVGPGGVAEAAAVPPARNPAPSGVCAPPATVQSAAPAVQQIVTALQPPPRILPPQARQRLTPAPPVQGPLVHPANTAATVPPVPAPPSPPPVRPAEIAPPAPQATPRVSKVSHEVDEEPADSPIGDWQTQGEKGMVRIEPCGQALCGYVLDPSSNAKGETVLVDMKSKSTSEWSGNIYSRDSGNSYYGTISMKGPNSLKVEACALGRFFCSGNVWSRADIKPVSLMSDRGNWRDSRW